MTKAFVSTAEVVEAARVGRLTKTPVQVFTSFGGGSTRSNNGSDLICIGELFFARLYSGRPPCQWFDGLELLAG